MNSSMASKFLLAITFFSIFFHFEVQSNGNGMKEEHSNAERCRNCLVQKSSSVLTVPNALFLIEGKNSRAPYFSFRWVPKFVCHGISLDDIGKVLNNKVLVAATVSAAIGQLLKPLTSTILYGRKFDFKAVVQAGGFPSTHSAAVVATATSLGLERGFSDAIFGLAVIYAGLVMYDAQHMQLFDGIGSFNFVFDFLLLKGVRREVGTHAKELNKVLLSRSHSPLKESIGHTEVEVIGGALLGFLVALAILTYA